jgi:hypothetical protein
MASSFEEAKEGLHPMQSTVEQLSSWAAHEQTQRRDRRPEDTEIAQAPVPSAAGPSPFLKFLVPPPQNTMETLPHWPFRSSKTKRCAICV